MTLRSKKTIHQNNYLSSAAHPALYGMMPNAPSSTFLLTKNEKIKSPIKRSINCDLKKLACLADHNAIDQSIAEY